MDGRGGCCITKYSGIGGIRSLSYGMSKVDKIMLKFRPIAPKPITSGSGSSSSTVDNTDVGTKRRKRKYVRTNKANTKNIIKNSPKKRKISQSSSGSGAEETTVASLVTLPLMPETPERKDESWTKNYSEVFGNKHMQTVCDGHVTRSGTSGHVTNNLVMLLRKAEVVSLVTMECVTDTWMNSDLGLTFVTDQMRMMDMEVDTCPSFVTDSRDTVVWTNKAYREMVAGGGGGETVAVVVVKKFNRVTMPVCCSAFTCSVKVTSSAPFSVTAPCDVWRLRSGGYAWRLDVKTALSLAL